MQALSNFSIQAHFVFFSRDNGAIIDDKLLDDHREKFTDQLGQTRDPLVHIFDYFYNIIFILLFSDHFTEFRISVRSISILFEITYNC